MVGRLQRVQSELARPHVEQRNSRPYHPTAYGEVERVQQAGKLNLRVPAANHATSASDGPTLTSELLRELTIGPMRHYVPPKRNKPDA